MNKETFFYIEINAICIVILTIYLSNLKGNLTKEIGRENTKKELIKLVVYTILTCFCDLIYGIIRGDFFPGSRILISACCLAYLVGFVMIAFSWMRYVSVIMDYKPENDKAYKILRNIPLGIFAIAAASNPVTNILFTIDENNIYERSGGIFIHWFAMWFYLLYTIVIAGKTLVNKRESFNRQLYFPFVYFIIPPIITGILQMYNSNIACYQAGITISIVLIFIANHNYEMAIDSLTGIDNRHSLEKLKARFFRRQSEMELAFFMIDLNDFKKVNDAYGHNVGDRMLKRTAELLREACTPIEGQKFICRFGGDEFLVITINEPNIREKFTQLLENLFEQETELGEDIRISASIGFAAGCCKCEEDFQTLLMKADENMYAIKVSERSPVANGEAKNDLRRRELEVY